MPKHIKVLLMLLALLALAFAGGKWFFTPASFWAYGHYRAASVDEIASAKPKFLEPAAFSATYPKQYATWSDGIHKVIKCQDCHLAQLDPQATGGALPTPRDSLKLCPICHQRIAGRPATQPQIDLASHYRGQQCVSCHDPHSPLFSPAGKPIALAAAAGGAHADVAAGKTLSARCVGCHGPAGVSVAPTFPNLACQKDTYLVSALSEYQAGTRTNPVMGGLAKALNRSDVRNVAAYFAGLPCAK